MKEHFFFIMMIVGLIAGLIFAVTYGVQKQSEHQMDQLRHGFFELSNGNIVKVKLEE